MAKQINKMSEYLFVNTLLQDVSVVWVLALTKSSSAFSFTVGGMQNMEYILQLSPKCVYHTWSIHFVIAVCVLEHTKKKNLPSPSFL